MRRPPPGFLDTNIVLYALDGRDTRKQGIAQSLIATGRLRTSSQVALEASRNLILKLGYEKHEVAPAIQFLLPIMQPTTGETIERAWTLMARYDLSVWDAAIVAAALSARCTLLYSEDFQHGQTLEGVRVVNPFLAPP